MHPFLDGNGRTARAVEALMLQRAGLTDHLFIAMSNYYYDEKAAYLAALSAVSGPDHDLTPFLLFGLRGIKVQCERLFREIRTNVSKSIYRNTVHELFGRLESKRKSVLAKRHIAVLEMMLEKESISLPELFRLMDPIYGPLKAGRKGEIRDLLHLLGLAALKYNADKNLISLNLDWPKNITESGFLERAKKMPKASYTFPSLKI